MEQENILRQLFQKLKGSSWSPSAGRLQERHEHCLFLLAMSFHGLNNHCSSHCVNMLEEESNAVTADGVKTLTTFPWSWFMQSIHPITGDGLIPPGWNGQRLYIFIFYTPVCRLRHYFTLCLHLHFACNASQIMTNEHTCHQMHLFPRPTPEACCLPSRNL